MGLVLITILMCICVCEGLAQSRVTDNKIYYKLKFLKTINIIITENYKELSIIPIGDSMTNHLEKRE
jgi:hypothetical protein